MNILVVDDSEAIACQLRSLLIAKGCRVLTAGSGEEALATAREHPPDLVISDILMPGMDGFTLCREWKKDERTSISK